MHVAQLKLGRIAGACFGESYHFNHAGAFRSQLYVGDQHLIANLAERSSENMAVNKEIGACRTRKGLEIKADSALYVIGFFSSRSVL